jgi:hypothetical protein
MFLRKINFYETTRHSNSEDSILHLLHWVLKLNGFSNIATSNIWRMESISYVIVIGVKQLCCFLFHSSIFVTIEAYK